MLVTSSVDKCRNPQRRWQPEKQTTNTKFNVVNPFRKNPEGENIHYMEGEYNGGESLRRQLNILFRTLIANTKYTCIYKTPYEESKLEQVL